MDGDDMELAEAQRPVAVPVESDPPETEMQALLRKYSQEGKAASGSRRVFASAAPPISTELVHMTRRERAEAEEEPQPISMTMVGGMQMQRQEHRR
jgi:hypothetical protein